ncbi:hypothetical protein N7474_004648 [Penicillium riverlandense]|uniref:uncharacterized protein n=1 Tax=Penicillium riverlandense TaxID=1903569 RepID=UPI00254820BF|nr:uncharacterized protein N7474_004648 [Penicillium riverlandense]KAJ5819057.1 hypothetical protein N7474_004648 [Penicillium riverlandense]
MSTVPCQSFSRSAGWITTEPCTATQPYVPTNLAAPETPPLQQVPQHVYQFARLIPVNEEARVAVEATARTNVEHHRKFIGETIWDNRATKCFSLSLNTLPEFPQIGWRIGRGCRKLRNGGVDLLLYVADEGHVDRVAGLHARFNWVKGAGGFFLISDNENKRVVVNGEPFRADKRLIYEPRNDILIGGCFFTLQYVNRTHREEGYFQAKLAQVFRQFHHDENPLILSTPENYGRFGNWIVQYPISKGAFGIVYMVVHFRTGYPAAAKRIFKSRRNAPSVDREMEMTRRISQVAHRRIVSALAIINQPAQGKAEIARMRSLLDETWEPIITDEYIIISPLSNATFRSIYTSDVSLEGRIIFFAQLLDAVAFLHSHGIWHRDIKPDNVLVRTYDPPDAMLTDFGCASDNPSILYDHPGTVPYLAPEQVEGQRHGRAVDYWSCGIVGWELFEKRSVRERIWPGQDLVYYHQRLESSDSPLARCARAMLVEDPNLRMTAADALPFFNHLQGSRAYP